LIDLRIEADKAFFNAKKRGLPLDNKSIDKHILEEVKELLTAKPLRRPKSLDDIMNTQDNNEFLYKYSYFMKDSLEDELADHLIIGLTKSRVNSICPEKVVMIKQRVNSLRKD